MGAASTERNLDLMPDRRRHRGPHPDDRRLFATDALRALVPAVRDTCWLRGRGYPENALTKLVGDRYGLDRRQRIAVQRCACSDDELAERRARRVAPERLRGSAVAIDGFNLLTTVEAALAGGVVLRARDSCLRDLASMHGTWRTVDETVPAIEAVGRVLEGLGAGPCRWLLDRPVSNSGRLAAALREVAARRAWPWQVETIPDPDRELRISDAVAATADSAVLDRCASWLNLASLVVDAAIPSAWIVDLACDGADVAG
jgi:hypothetical protein